MAWQIDPAHSQIQFAVRHMMIATVRGRFERFSGTVEFNEDDPAATTVEMQIEANSISTNQADRDAHLKSPDFLHAEQYPYLTFKSKRVVLQDGTHAQLIGDLTIRDVTREVTLDVEYIGQAKSPWGTTSAGFTARTRINRKDWNLTWNQVLESGGVLVADEVGINIELELVRQAQERPQALAA